MNYTISNHRLSVTVSDYGAELQSVLLDGTERLWQGNPDVWSGRSPILFPFVGRIKNGSYTFEGKEHSAPSPRGFAKKNHLRGGESDRNCHHLPHRLLGRNQKTLPL